MKVYIVVIGILIFFCKKKVIVMETSALPRLNMFTKFYNREKSVYRQFDFILQYFVFRFLEIYLKMALTNCF